MSLKDYFAFSRGEKRGAVVLLLIIFLLILAQFIPDYIKDSHQTDFSEFESEINAFEKNKASTDNQSASEIELFEFNPNTISDLEWKKLGFNDWQIKNITKYKESGGNWKTKSDVSKIYGLDSSRYNELEPFILLPENLNYESESNFTQNKNIEYFDFNPNIISESDWKKLGFSDWQIKNIFKYKSKGGSWKTKGDVAKIFGLKTEEFEKLKPYILLPEEIEKTNISKNDFSKKVNINSADAKEFTHLKGIYSEKYGEVIVKYRNKLGGFSNKEQLLEVWNMKKETYDSFISQVELGKISLKQLDINSLSKDELKNHPYITWNIANAIVNYREQHGNFKSVTDIKKIHLISDEIYSKIVPYLKID